MATLEQAKAWAKLQQSVDKIVSRYRAKLKRENVEQDAA